MYMLTAEVKITRFFYGSLVENYFLCKKTRTFVHKSRASPSRHARKPYLHLACHYKKHSSVPRGLPHKEGDAPLSRTQNCATLTDIETANCVDTNQNLYRRKLNALSELKTYKFFCEESIDPCLQENKAKIVCALATPPTQINWKL